MALEGGERLVLSTLSDLRVDSTGYVDDASVVATTKMFLEDVRDLFETLEGKGFVQRARTMDGFRAYVTAQGRVELRRFEPIPSSTVHVSAAGTSASIEIVPSVTSQTDGADYPQKQDISNPRATDASLPGTERPHPTAETGGGTGKAAIENSPEFEFDQFIPTGTPDTLGREIELLRSRSITDRRKGIELTEATARQSALRLDEARKANGGWGQWSPASGDEDVRKVTHATRLLAAWVRWTRCFPSEPNAQQRAKSRAKSNRGEVQQAIDVLFKNGHAGIYWEAWNFDSGRFSYSLDETFLCDLDLSNRFFNFVSFKRCELSGANFDNSFLMGAQFDYSRLVGAKLRTWVLRRASFIGADLRNVDLTGAKMETALLNDADLSEATLSGVVVDEVCFAGAKLDRAVVSDGHWLRRIAGSGGQDMGLSSLAWRVVADYSDGPLKYRIMPRDKPTWLSLEFWRRLMYKRV